MNRVRQVKESLTRLCGLAKGNVDYDEMDRLMVIRCSSMLDFKLVCRLCRFLLVCLFHILSLGVLRH